MSQEKATLHLHEKETFCKTVIIITVDNVSANEFVSMNKECEELSEKVRVLIDENRQ